MEELTLRRLKIEDYPSLKKAMIEAYPYLDEPYWELGELTKLIKAFPEGQMIVEVNGEFAACALSIIVDQDTVEKAHTYQEVTGDYTFSTHNGKGDILYGIDVFVRPRFRGLGCGRKLYDFRRTLCQQLNLKGIIFGGRIPNYHKHMDDLTPKQYIRLVQEDELDDPVLDFHLHENFEPIMVLDEYLEGDKASAEYAVLLKWDNPKYR